MAKVIRNTPLDISTGHCWISCPPAEGSPNTFANNFQLVRSGDKYVPHIPSCTPIPSTHPVAALIGSPSVFVNNLPLTRDGDSLSCGDVADNGSHNVFANGGGDGGPAKGDGETTGYVILPPNVVYPGNGLVIAYYWVLVLNEQETFVKGCPIKEITPDSYSPLIEEDTGREFKNYPRIGAINLPPYVPPDRRLPINLSSFKADPPLPAGISLDPATGTIRGALQFPVEEGDSVHRIYCSNFVGAGPNGNNLTIRKVKVYNKCP